MESHNEIEDTAAALLAKRDSGDWTDEDQANLTQWMDASTARRIAVLRLQSAWEKARRLRAISAGLQPGTIPPAGQWRQSPFFADEMATNDTESASSVSHVAAEPVATAPSTVRSFKYLAAAATVVFTILAGTYFYASGMFAGERYSTKVGARETVPLADGSSITLNTSSKLRVSLTDKSREIRLDRGEAYFDVAPDPTRPFIVTAGDRRILVLGTKFSIRRDGADLHVTVTEGKIAITPLNPSAEQAEGADSTRRAPRSGSSEVLLAAGSIAHTGRDSTIVKKTSLSEAEESLSWRSGYVVFHETALGDAVAELNRYNTHKIGIDDPALASVRISGTFRPTNYQAFLRLLETGFAIHAAGSGDGTTLTKD